MISRHLIEEPEEYNCEHYLIVKSKQEDRRIDAVPVKIEEPCCMWLASWNTLDPNGLLTFSLISVFYI